VSAPIDLARLSRFLAQETGARSVAIAEFRRLPNGAVQENWRVDAAFEGGRWEGRKCLVLRMDAATTLGIGLSRAQEFAVQRAAHRAGVAVAEPLLLCNDPGIIGKPFFLMRWVPGDGAGDGIVAGERGGDRDRLIARLAQELARLHSMGPSPELACLGPPPSDAARASLAEQKRLLAADPDPHPVAEWAIRWLERHLPPPAAPVLCHGDFRTGNFLVDGQGLAAVLDWEFAHWGDGDEDLGWFCLGCWRFGAYRQEAGGIGSREAFYRAYAEASGRTVRAERAHWWEAMAGLRWLVIALRQRDRCVGGGERSLDLALTGRRPAECEFELLKLTGAA